MCTLLSLELITFNDGDDNNLKDNDRYGDIGNIGVNSKGHRKILLTLMKDLWQTKYVTKAICYSNFENKE